MNAKHNKLRQMINHGCLAILGISLGSTSVYAAYDWNGSASSAWTTPANWNGNAIPTYNATEGSRLNVGSGQTPARELIYDATLGTTVYGGNSFRGMVIGSNGTGTNHITGGTLSTAGNTTVSGTSFADILGNGGSGVGYFILDGGNYVSGASGLSVGLNNTGQGTLILNNGTATVTVLYLNSFNATISLEGGTLAVSNINIVPPFNAGSGLPNIYYEFNGGTLQAIANSTNFLPATTTATVKTANVRNGGVIINTAGYNVTVGQALFHSTVPGDATTDGGLTKNGSGTLTTTGANTYTGNTTVNGGTLEIAQPSLATNSTVVVASGAVLQLDFGVTNVVSALVLNGITQPGGVYNSTTAPAYFAGPGSLQVSSSIANYPTNITLSVISGNTLNLTWPATHLGWLLQSNSIDLSATSDWYDISGTATGTNYSINIDPDASNVFYRLRAP